MARTKVTARGLRKRSAHHYYDDDLTDKERLEKRKVIENYLERKEKKRKLVSDLIKQALDDQEKGRKPDYSNMSKVVQQWIQDDQQKRLKRHVTNNEEMLDANLVKQLPRDIVFDIIDFIPTFSERSFEPNLTHMLNKNSKTSGISVEELLNQVPDSMNPEKLKEKRIFECAMVYDSGFLTCHKMRLICKEYALRMKKKIFSIENLDLTSFDAENRFFMVKLLSFVKDQQYYHEKNECDNVLMYFHYQQIKNLMIVNIESLEYGVEQNDVKENNKEDSSDEDDTVLVNDTPTNGTTGTTPTDPSTAPVPTEEIIEPVPTEEDLDDTINMYSGHLDLIPHHEANLGNHTYMYQRSLPVDLASLRVLFTDNNIAETFIVNPQLLAPIVGVNTVLKSIKLDGDFHYDMYPVMLKSCLNLRKLSLYNSFMSLDNEPENSLVHENVEIIEFTFPTTDTYELLDSALGPLIQVFPNLSTVSIALEPSGVFLSEDIRQSIDDFSLDGNTKRLVFTIDGTHYKDITPTGRARKWPIVNILITTTNSLSPTFFSTALLNSGSSCQETIISHYTCNDDDIPIERKKEFMDHLFIDGNYPIESNFEGAEHPLLFQYAVYIANEYQNGRLFSLFSQGSNVEDALRYGWQVNDSWEEVLKSLNPADFKLVLGHLRKTYSSAKFFQLIRSLALEALTNIHSLNLQTTLLTIVEYLRGEQFQYSDIFSPVRCIVDTNHLKKFNIETLHIPFLSYALFSNDLHVATQILRFAKEEDLFYTNENGDTFLTCNTSPEFSHTVFESALRRAPKLANISNKQNRSPLHIFASYLNTEVGSMLYFMENFGFDVNQPDIVGKTALDYMTLPTQAICKMLQ
ncbi:predicted protein [Naegleria gruberi]|uniref:Predicted protein n=1 Tax=Naegleria gruberi TaxID=5762 RepID=D2VLT4_NAEGR|nr:uncharacterized protein NAEGRDRAFT_69892 [Naegleria gruberi]EFC42199.1 predicted protein [Naegleria gruberi]|eukprot:XP_002674943.1 predicted protein [Naegleria gruberi strain NEG-M]